jgi:hypothetical protein
MVSMSRRPARIKIVNLEAGMPTVEQARLRLDFELKRARDEGFAAVKVIHGYGSSGVGGALRTAVQAKLRAASERGDVRAVIYGEDWRVSDEQSWPLLQKFPEWKDDSDLGRGNRGITLVVF